MAQAKSNFWSCPGLSILIRHDCKFYIPPERVIMKKLVKIIIIIIIVALVGGFIYWQFIKKDFIKDSIETAITKKTDSLYYIHYDSSFIDEVNGNVSFFNVTLQSDSAQKKLLNSTDSLPNALYNIRVEEITAHGIDVAGLLEKENVAAGKILLIKPVIQIINTGSDKPKPLTKNDSLALYQKILGNLNSIKADTILIQDGTVLMTNKNGEPQTTLENINITLHNFLIDSTKNYESVISYFIKDVHATVENIQLPPAENNTRFNIEKLDYDAVNRSLKVGAVKQYKVGNMNALIDLKNISVTDLNTDAFIHQQRLKAGTVKADGGLITIYKDKKSGDKKSGDQVINLSSDLVDQAQVGSIKLGSTKLIVIDKAAPSAKPFVLNNAKFEVLTPLEITESTTLNTLVNNAKWEFSADGFSFNSKDGIYKMSMGDFMVNNATGIAKVGSFFIKPLISEEAFAKRVKHSRDLYNLEIKNISLTGINIKELVSNAGLDAETATFQVDIKIFNDKTLPSDGKSKVGNYPHQMIRKLVFPLYVKKAIIKNGSVSYRERGMKSALVGNVVFTDMNATITNLTNIPERLKSDPDMVLNATAKFLGKANLTSKWVLPMMNTSNGTFHIEGQLVNMDAVALNPVTKPLALAEIKQGHIDKVKFSMNGSNTSANGNVLFLYKDLKLNVLKKGDEEDPLKKKGLISFLANTLVKNSNDDPSNSKDVVYERDINRSFFNLVWKTIFTGVKNTALGKKDQEPPKK